MKDDKKSIMQEALIDFKDIQEAAEANAKKKLAEEFPKEFNNILKEELNKNKKSAKESYKKLDEGKESEKSDNTESNKESVMKNQEKETKKVVETAGEGLPFKEKATVPSKDVAKLNEKAVDEDVHITDTVGKSDPFAKKSAIPSKDVAKLNEKKVNEVAKTKKPLQTEEFDITELDMQSVGNALENADGNDDVLTMENIEEELSAMEGLGEELKGINATSPSYMESGNKGVAYNKLVEMRKQLDEMISSLSEGGVNEMHQGNFNPGTIDKMHQGAYDSKLIDEEEPITDKDVEDVLGAPEKPVEEAHTLSYSGRRTMAGRTLPGNKDYLSTGEQDQAPYATMHETQKRIIGLIKENKGLTKKFNEVKRYKDTVSPLLENYKIALDKYRNQLKDMALFNTNLAHVNNLLVNEELALTQDDKIRIINEFKKVDNIADSQKK